MKSLIIPFSKLSIKDIDSVGGKNASLGEMIQQLNRYGILVPDGFAITVDAFNEYLRFNKLVPRLQQQLSLLNRTSLENLPEVAAACRTIMSEGKFPEPVIDAIKTSYKELSDKYGPDVAVAVRSSATAEDSPVASFAGQHDSFLNVSGLVNILETIRKCYTSMFNDRAIKYRIDNQFGDFQVRQSVGIQLMVRSDTGSAGVAFTVDPETGNENVIYVTGAWGLGEIVVQGAVSADEFYVFKKGLEEERNSIVTRRLGLKQHMIVYPDQQVQGTVKKETPPALRDRFVLDDIELLNLSRWCLAIERHYERPMDIEWAKDGITGKLYIVQARAVTANVEKKRIKMIEYDFKTSQKPIVKGKAVGRSIISGRVCIVRTLADAIKVNAGDIIVADITNPDWNALLKKGICIVTNKGGRTSHASIVARELGIPAVVGTLDATDKLKDGQDITVSCISGDEGLIYNGKLDWDEREVEIDNLSHTITKPMFILADPQKALHNSTYPNEGVGLLRMEFIINNCLQIHPMALVKFDELQDGIEKMQIEALTRHYADKKEFFIGKLAESIALVAAAFWPKPVIVRTSDFKTNEYAKLLGGKMFEPEEENPMLGFRGASRYYNVRYKEGFGLECRAIQRVRDEMGLTNVKVMIPFCRTVEEAAKVLAVMKEFKLERNKNGLEILVMAEVPSNILLADKFAELFDGFSIGSNDLTQLTLGLDRDSAIVSDLFNEANESVAEMIRHLIIVAHRHHVTVGLCGQAPSDRPEYANFLVKAGIDSISFSPDALIRGIENIIRAEKAIKREHEIVM